MFNHFEKVDLTEMNKLADGLAKMGIEFTRKKYWNGEQIRCKDWDAICHCGSYGHEFGLLEVMGSVSGYEDDVEGYLTAQEILGRL